MNIYDSFKLFLDDKKVYCSPKTVIYYNNVSHIFFTFLDSKEINDTDSINCTVLKEFVLSLREKNIKNTSIHTYMRAVKNYCYWGISSGFIPPFDYHIKLPRMDPDQILPLSKTEVNNILKYIHTYCHNPGTMELFFRLMLDCGLRSSEALNLCRSDIDAEQGIIKINQSKYDKSRMIPLPACVRSLLPYADGKLFSFTESGKHSFFARMQKQTHLDRLHAHLLRHTFATSYMVKVGNLEFLRMYLGHSSYDVTKTYIQSSYQCKLLKYDIYEIDDCFT